MLGLNIVIYIYIYYVIQDKIIYFWIYLYNTYT